MDEKIFNEKVAAIWALYSAAKTLTQNGIANRASTEGAQSLIRKSAVEIGDALAAGLASNT